VFLSLLFAVSLLTALPACAQGSLMNQVPKAIQIGNHTLTGTYNAKTKTLSYTYETRTVKDVLVEGQDKLVDLALLACSTDTKINRDFATYSMNFSNDLNPEGLAFNDMIRSGKIKKITIHWKDGYSPYDQGFTYQFTRKNGRITRIEERIEEAEGYDYSYMYDKAGNVQNIKCSTYNTATIKAANNKISSIRVKDLIEGSTQTYTPKYDTSGNPVISSNLRIQWNPDGTIAQCQLPGEDASIGTAIYTYMTI